MHQAPMRPFALYRVRALKVVETEVEAYTLDQAAAMANFIAARDKLKLLDITPANIEVAVADKLADKLADKEITLEPFGGP